MSAKPLIIDRSARTFVFDRRAPVTLRIDRSAHTLVLDRRASATLRIERNQPREFVIQRNGPPGPAAPVPAALKGGFF